MRGKVGARAGVDVGACVYVEDEGRAVTECWVGVHVGGCECGCE